MNNKCPFCGEEMTPGVIQSRDGVYWSRKAGPMAALSWLNKDAITLADSGSSVFGGAAAEAFNCPAAKRSFWITPFAIPRYKIPNFPLQNPKIGVIIPYVNRGARRSGLRVGCHRPDPST